jgi:hypothetical protein
VEAICRQPRRAPGGARRGRSLATRPSPVHLGRTDYRSAAGTPRRHLSGARTPGTRPSGGASSWSSATSASPATSGTSMTSSVSSPGTASTALGARRCPEVAHSLNLHPQPVPCAYAFPARSPHAVPCLIGLPKEAQLRRPHATNPVSAVVLIEQITNLRFCRKITRSLLESGMLMWYGQHGGHPGDACGEVRAIFPHLDERQRRRLLGAEARALGHGGIRLVARAAGVRSCGGSVHGQRRPDDRRHRGCARARTGPGSRTAGPRRAGYRVRPTRPAARWAG